jgi:hypothetical protein
MRSPIALLVAVITVAAATPAWAHGEGALIAPAAWGGLGIGAVAGVWVGYKSGHPGVALGWGIALLFLALVVWAGLDGELVLGALVYLFIVPFAGAIPLAIAFFVTYATTVFLKERFFPADVPSRNEH